MAKLAWIFAILIWTSHVSAEVWKSQGTWNAQWETRYSEWVKKTAHPEMSLRPLKPYYAQVLDCADFIYYSRIIFSFENRIEFLAKDFSGKQISSQTQAFDAISDPDLRLKKFIRFVNDSTSTETLQRDSVLLPITRQSIRAGAFLITNKSQNHVWLIKDINQSGVPDMLSATSPESQFIYPAYSYPSSYSAFQKHNGFLSPSRGGFRRFFWPDEMRSGKSAEASQEQTRVSIAEYFESIQRRLAIKVENEEQRLERHLDELCMQMRIRTNVVTDATQLLEKGTMTRRQADEFSTVSRDAKIRDLIDLVTYESRFVQEQYSSPVRDKYQRFMKTFRAPQRFEAGDAEKFCFVQWATNRIEPLSELVSRFPMMSSKAEDTLSLRWGELGLY